jgi:hypothetical protein
MTPARRALACLASGGALGIMADISRIWIPGRLGTAAWLALFLAALLVLMDADTEATSLPLAAAAVGLGALVWRDAPALHLLNLATIGVCLVAGSRIGASLFRGAGGVAAWALAFAEAGAHAALGAAAAISESTWARLPRGRSLRGATSAAFGLVLVAPVLAVFSALFAEADPLFADGLRNAFRLDLSGLVPHALVIGAVGWASAGFLRGAVRGGGIRVPPIPGGGSIPFTTIGTALGCIAALFLIFVLLQARYLFGGDSLLGPAGSFSYADYARRGFFELVTVTGLTLPVLLLADWALDQRQGVARARFRSLAGLLLGLLGVIVVSALSRMALYTGMYGLTELRVYVTAFMLLLCAVFAWFGVTVLRGNRGAFMRGTLIAGGCAVAVLNVVDPDALIARVNLARSSARVPVDLSYLASLSADAVPALLAHSTTLGRTERCALVAELRGRWLAPSDELNIGRIAARRALQEPEHALERVCAIEP